MKGALIILGVIIAIGVILYLCELRHRRKEEARLAEEPAATADSEETSPQPAESAEQEDGCCGLHLVCEKDSLSPMSAEIEYYDDEELDRFAGVAPDAYSDSEIEEFRDILLSMRPDDIAGWARSLQLRRISLPEPVRDELILIVAEARSARTNPASVPAV